MKLIPDLKEEIVSLGYNLDDANAKICQDIILKALSNSTLNKNVTIKGGVVMRSISSNIRRATQDLDIDFIKYSINDDSIINFINLLNASSEYTIELTGEISELNQQEYHGKRVFVVIKDRENNELISKIDIGVHSQLDIKQKEYCFDICVDDKGVSLLINSPEQMFTEKLKSLLKFGQYSTRYKDIFDLYYLTDKVNLNVLKNCFNTYIYSDSSMKENNISDVLNRINDVFCSKTYLKSLSTTDKNWLNVEIVDVINKIINFLQTNI